MEALLEVGFILLKIAVVILGFAFPVGTLMTLLGDRKQSSMIQNRVGPNRARLPGINHPIVGIPHFIADGIKMVFKEDIIPAKANKFWHNVAPALGSVSRRSAVGQRSRSATSSVTAP